ncbi:type II toxin-antitoxin system VapB family antitoxin [Propionibacteriaceae bacterium Y1923]
MSKTLIDLDDGTVARAMELSGLPTKKAVVSEALEAYLRRLELMRYEEFLASGALDDLGDPEVTKQAQR